MTTMQQAFQNALKETQGEVVTKKNHEKAVWGKIRFSTSQRSNTQTNNLEKYFDNRPHQTVFLKKEPQIHRTILSL